MSHLDYCNAVFHGLPEVDLKRLQRVQNVAAKLVLNKSCRDSVTECMFHLHRLPIKSRIDYKILTLTHLPNEIRGIQMHETFKKSIKTYRFKSI